MIQSVNHRKEGNLTENHTTPMVSEIQSMKKIQVCSWIAFGGKAKTKVETSSLRNLKILSRNLNEIVLSDFHLCSHIVEKLYCKRPILCLASSKILTPHLLTARRVFTPAFGAGGGHTRWVEKGVGGQHFGRRETCDTQLCNLHM